MIATPLLCEGLLLTDGLSWNNWLLILQSVGIHLHKFNNVRWFVARTREISRHVTISIQPLLHLVPYLLFLLIKNIRCDTLYDYLTVLERRWQLLCRVVGPVVSHQLVLIRCIRDLVIDIIAHVIAWFAASNWLFVRRWGFNIVVRLNVELVLIGIEMVVDWWLLLLRLLLLPGAFERTTEVLFWSAVRNRSLLLSNRLSAVLKMIIHFLYTRIKY